MRSGWWVAYPPCGFETENSPFVIHGSSQSLAGEKRGEATWKALDIIIIDQRHLSLLLSSYLFLLQLLSFTVPNETCKSWGGKKPLPHLKNRPWLRNVSPRSIPRIRSSQVSPVSGGKTERTELIGHHPLAYDTIFHFSLIATSKTWKRNDFETSLTEHQILRGFRETFRKLGLIVSI